jgi:hypothetical protein
MANQNDFLPFATGADADVLSQEDYAALPALATGFATGVANSAQFNKVFRQSSTIAATVAKFIVDNAGVDAIDDGTIATLVANLKLAVQQIILDYEYAPLASPALTGAPTAPTPATDDNSTKIATTAHVKNAIASKAPIASPSFSGTPTASTPAGGDNSGKLATTGFVANALGPGGSIYNPTFNSVKAAGLDSGGAHVRMTSGGYGVLLRNDGNSWYVLLTPAGQADGGFNGLRPLIVSLSTGAVTIDATGAGVNFGGAVNLPSPAAGDTSSRAVNSAWVRSQGYLTGITLAQIISALGFTPVQQGGGAFQASSKIFLGWDGTRPRIQVDVTDLGEIAMLSDIATVTRITDFPRSIGIPGWQKLPSGLILQWGVAAVENGTPVGFPIAFPTGVLQMWANDQGNLSDGLRLGTALPIAGNNAVFRGYGVNPQTGVYTGTTLGWLALGF